MQLTNIDIVIVSFAKNKELLQVTNDCLDSLFQSENDSISFHVKLIESNLNENYEQYNNNRHSIEVIHPSVPFGYHRYLNIGIKAGNSTYVVLCNSDLTFEKNWASNIIKAFNQNPTALSACPWEPSVLGPNDSHINNVYEGYRVRVELAGWCIFQKRSIYELLGQLNEDVDFWFSDNILANELELRKIKHILVPSSVVYHHDKNLGKTGESLDSMTKESYTTGAHAKYIIALDKLVKQLNIT